ncbi:TIGR02270 family protein [Variovorax sp. VRV01]|uniref:TIGR02270 family protein n=1 Tax=Variovorax sp. VRV01 TaxID=2769259 RepID=UPI001CE07D98|nr:TIGR02270 family protein [Variovorax sp. VRV01]
MTTDTIARSAAAPMPLVVQRHAEESALLCNQRFFLAASGHTRLHHLRRLDDRLAAHLDGLAVARDAGSRACDEALARAGRGEVFAAIVLALENHDLPRIERLLAIAELLPDVRDAVALAGGWASGESLRGIAKDMLDSPHAFRRAVAIAACDFHMVDPGDALHAAVADADVVLRGQALRAAGECGRRDLAAVCIAALQDEDAGCRFWAARSAVLLGERHKPVHPLHDATLLPGTLHGRLALSLLFKLATPAQAAPLLAEMLDKPAHVRDAVRCAGTVGDTRLVPWLIAQMEEPALARLAGEAFSTITGLDLAWLDLERKPPEGVESGPRDAPEDDDVAMDEDDGLPWPDPARISSWWAANGRGFVPGERYFLGQVPSWAHCVGVLKHGFQRQRLAAAEYLCLLRPGSKLFPTGAPAWRQQRWLDQWPDE